MKKQPAETGQRYFTLKEAAAYLGVNIASVSRAVRTGRLTVWTVEKLVDRKELERYELVKRPGRPATHEG